MMNFEIVLFIIVFVTVLSNNESDFIFDYFIYKNIGGVVGFTCNIAKDDFSLIKRFNEIGIPAKFTNLNKDIQMHRLGYSIYRNIGIFFDVRCYNSSNVVSVFLEAKDYRMYDELRTWLILGPDVSNVLNVIDDMSMGYSTDFVIAIPMSNAMYITSNSEGYELYDVYNIWKERGTTMKITYIGYWNKKTEINILKMKSRYESRSDLQGVGMRASFFTPKFKPQNVTAEEYFQDHTYITRDTLAKFGFIVLTHLANMFHFRIECVITPKWEKGDSIGPVVRSVKNNESDVTGNPAVMTIKRLNMVFFLFELFPFRTCFLLRNSQPTADIKINEVLGPLGQDVWYCILALLLLSTLMLILLFRFESNGSVIKRCSDSILIIIGLVGQQGTDIPMTRSSTRLLFLFVMIFNYLIYNYYGASIVSTRLSQPIFAINDSLVELAKTSLRLSSERMVYFELFINKPDWETKTFNAMRWKKMAESDKWEDPPAAMRLVQSGTLAYHTHPDLGYQFINRWFSNREICELSEVHLQKPTYVNLGFSHNNSFLEMMKIGSIKFAEVGLRKRQIIRWKVKKPECLKNVLSSSSINMYEFLPHILLLTFGMGLAVILFIVEILVNKLKR